MQRFWTFFSYWYVTESMHEELMQNEVTITSVYRKSMMIQQVLEPNNSYFIFFNLTRRLVRWFFFNLLLKKNLTQISLFFNF